MAIRDLNASVGTVTSDDPRHTGDGPNQYTSYVNPANVNDGNDSTFAHIETGITSAFVTYLKSDLGAAYSVSSFNISVSNDGNRITDYQYSLDGSTWFSLTGVETGARSTTPGATFTFAALVAARYFALQASQVGTVLHPTHQLNRWEINGDDIVSDPPVAAFVYTPHIGFDPLFVEFTDTSTGVIDEWFWNFGDGHTSTAQNPTHLFVGVGVYTVTLTVSNNGGSDSVSHDVTVIEPEELISDSFLDFYEAYA